METIQVEIFGHKYSLKGGTDAEYVRGLAELVDSRMREVQRGAGTADGYRIAILAALNLADELQRARSQQEATQRTAESSLKRLLELTEEEPSR